MAFPGSDIAGERFSEIELIGSSPLGPIYRAFDQRLERQVLVRELDQALSEEMREAARACWQLESRLCTSRELQAPQIVRAYGFYEQAGEAFLSLELHHWETLADLLAQQPRLPEEPALRIALDLARAIAVHWKRHIVHRDIYPGNVLIVRDETGAPSGARLTGYGSALDLRATQNSQGSAQRIPGTSGYHSPEQASGSFELNAASDSYNVGLLLWEMLAGEPRYAYQDDSILAAQFKASAGTTELVRRALREHAAQRYPQPAELIAQLEQALATLSASPTRHTPPTPASTQPSTEERPQIPFPESDLAGARFTHIEQIGEGGFARVYRAFDQDLGRQVAVKEISTEVSSEARADVLRRFQQEARMAAQLKSEHVVGVYNYDRRHQYLFLEYIEHGSLAELLAAQPRLPEPVALLIARDIVRAISAHWAKQIVHRDIKPSNVLLVKQQDAIVGAKLADYGVAQDEESLKGTRIDRTQHPGTPIYMSPEQRDSTDPLTAASDLYNVGLLLWEMLAGEPRYNYRHSTITSGGFRASGKLTNLIKKALAPEIEQRYSQPAELLRDIERLLPAEWRGPITPGAKAVPATPPKPGGKPQQPGASTPAGGKPLLNKAHEANTPTSGPDELKRWARNQKEGAQPPKASATPPAGGRSLASRIRLAAIVLAVLLVCGAGGVVVANVLGGTPATPTPTRTPAPSSTPATPSRAAPTATLVRTRAPSNTRAPSPSQTSAPSATATAEPSASAELSATTAPAPRATTRRPATARATTARPATARPTSVPTAVPPTGTATAVLPTAEPTAVPATEVPTEAPTAIPPTDVPTDEPTEAPRPTSPPAVTNTAKPPPVTNTARPPPSS